MQGIRKAENCWCTHLLTGVEQIALVPVERRILIETLRQVRVGQEPPPKDNQVTYATLKGCIANVFIIASC